MGFIQRFLRLLAFCPSNITKLLLLNQLEAPSLHKITQRCENYLGFIRETTAQDSLIDLTGDLIRNLNFQGLHDVILPANRILSTERGGGPLLINHVLTYARVWCSIDATSSRKPWRPSGLRFHRSLPRAIPGAWLTVLASRQSVPPRWGYDCVIVYYLPVVPDQASLVLWDSGLRGLSVTND